MKQSDDEIEREEWLAIRREAGRKIDPKTAEVLWCYRQTGDPYGIYPEPPEEYRQTGREYFARSPDRTLAPVRARPVACGDSPAARPARVQTARCVQPDTLAVKTDWPLHA